MLQKISENASDKSEIDDFFDYTGNKFHSQTFSESEDSDTNEEHRIIKYRSA